MPRARYQKVDAERKQRLLDAAVKEFAEHGYELASINRILLAAGLSKGAFYYYFDDKADLAATVVIEMARPTWGELDGLVTPSTPDAFWAELRRFSLAQLKRMEADRTRYEAVMRLSNAVMKDPQLVARVLPAFQEGREALLRFIQRGVELGAMRKDLPLHALTALFEAIKTAAYKSLFPGDRVPTEAELESFTDLVIDLNKRIAAP